MKKVTLEQCIRESIGGTGKFSSSFTYSAETGLGRATKSPDNTNQRTFHVPLPKSSGLAQAGRLPGSPEGAPEYMDPDYEYETQIILGNKVKIPKKKRSAKGYDSYDDPTNVGVEGDKPPDPEKDEKSDEAPDSGSADQKSSFSPPKTNMGELTDREGNKYRWIESEGRYGKVYTSPWRDRAGGMTSEEFYRHQLIRKTMTEQRGRGIGSAIGGGIKSIAGYVAIDQGFQLIGKLLGLSDEEMEQQFGRQKQTTPKAASDALADVKALKPISGGELSQEGPRTKKIKGRVKNILTGRRTKERKQK
tara:strand:- start:773 stop:1687 length:915 start_codon:yes stop_codon:yes gene_type:complete